LRLEAEYVELGGEAEGNQKSKGKRQNNRAKMRILYSAKAQRRKGPRRVGMQAQMKENENVENTVAVGYNCWAQG